jgi:hypothetical protein
MSRMQPHSSVAGASYDLIGNNAGPKFANATPSAPLGGTAATLGTMGLLTAGSFVYGIMKKRPQDLQLGYVLAGAAGTLPVAYDLWLNGGKKYGGLTNQGLFLTYTSLVAPPLIGMFAGSILGNQVMSGAPKPSSRKQPWYQGRFAASSRSDYDKKRNDDIRQKRQNERRRKGKSRRRRKGRKKGRRDDDSFANWD